MSSRSFSVGSYTRHVAQTVDPFNQRVMAFRNDDASELEDSPENWSGEKVRAAAEMFQREDKRQQDRAMTGQNAHQLQTMFGDCLHTLEHFEAAYQTLRSSNFLALNATEVKKQERAAAKARAEAERTRSVALSEDELYSMDLDELRMRANGVWGK